jgi:hypothetical protein
MLPACHNSEHRMSPTATGVVFSDVDSTVELSDGMTLVVPLHQFPRLARASAEQAPERENLTFRQGAALGCLGRGH